MWSKKQRIAHDLREAIARGDYPAGTALPAITELMATYEVARETVRGAIADLAHEGLVTPRNGIGTIVRDLGRVELRSRPGAAHPEWSNTSGEVASTLTIEAGPATADRKIAERLELSLGDIVIRRIRHYSKGRDVVLLHEQWISGKVAETIRKKTGYDAGNREQQMPHDLYTLMRMAGHPPASTTEVVTTRMPDPSEKETMNMPVGIPVLLTLRVTDGESGEKLETSNFVGCGDRSSQTYTVPI